MTPRATPPVLILGDFADQKDFFLARPYTYRIGSTAHAITVAEGFVTDMTSIPPPLRMFLSVHGRYGRAAVVHDYLYWSQACTKAQADEFAIDRHEGIRRWPGQGVDNLSGSGEVRHDGVECQSSRASS